MFSGKIKMPGRLLCARLHTAGLLLVLGCPAAAVQAQVGAAAAADGAGVAWPALAESRYVFQIPPPIGPLEIERYQTILVLSDAQKFFLERVYSQYQEECKTFEQAQSPLLRAAAAPLVERFMKTWTIDPAYAQETAAMCAREAEFGDALRKLDDGLLATIESVLAEVQRPMMRRVELHRQRWRCAVTTLYGSKLTKAQIDLSRVIEAARLPESVVADLESVMWEYEQAVTPWFVEADHRYRTNMPKIVELNVHRKFDECGQGLDFSNLDVRERSRELRDQIQAMRRQEVLAFHRIGDLNDQFQAKIFERLPADSGRAFRLMYLTRTYARVYPDRSDPEVIYLEVMKCKGISDDMRTVLEQSWTDYRKTYEAVCKDMRDETDRWQEWGALTWSSDGWVQHNQMMQVWWTQRTKKNEEFMQRVVSLVPAEVLREKDATLQEWKRKLERNALAESGMNPQYTTFE